MTAKGTAMGANKDMVYDRVGGLGIGTVIDRYTNFHDDPAGVEMLTVRFGRDGDEQIDADRLPEEVARRGEVYVYTNGVALAPMTYSSALKLVHELAMQNQIDETDIAYGDDGLTSQMEWQKTALGVVSSLIDAHGADIDTVFQPELTSVEQSHPFVDRAADAAVDEVAVRICLDMSVGALLCEHDAESDDLRGEFDRQRQAFDLVYDLATLHGQALNDLSATQPAAKP
jgi:hypothetical protein